MIALGIACLAAMIVVLAAIGWHVREMVGAVILCRAFAAELITAAIAFPLLIWGLPYAGLAIGVTP
jgi:hypothetical protein